MTAAPTVFPTATVPIATQMVHGIAVHRPIRRHPCRGVEADPLWSGRLRRRLIPQLHYIDKVVDVLVVLVVLVPQVQVMEKTVGNTLLRWSISMSLQAVLDPQVQVVEKTIDVPRFADRGEHR